MMGAGFTPGPWAYDADEEAIVSEVAALQIAQPFTLDDYPCVDPEDRPRVVAECRANARLIAAAPELYEALAGLAALLEAVRDDSVSTHFRFGDTEAERKNRIQQLLGYIEANADKVDDALEVCAAALAKARGDA